MDVQAFLPDGSVVLVFDPGIERVFVSVGGDAPQKHTVDPETHTIAVSYR